MFKLNDENIKPMQAVVMDASQVFVRSVATLNKAFDDFDKKSGKQKELSEAVGKELQNMMHIVEVFDNFLALMIEASSSPQSVKDDIHKMVDEIRINIKNHKNRSKVNNDTPDAIS